MNKSMLINLINSITFASTIKTKTEEDGTIVQKMESKIQLPAPAPILTEPVGFQFVYEKNNQIKIAAVKPHDDPHNVFIVYKEYNESGDLLTGEWKSNKLVSEYSTIVFDWYATMQSFSPAFCAATNISVKHAPEMYVPKMLGAAMKAFKQHPDQFRKSIHIFNHQMMQFNAAVENISIGIGNIQAKLLHQLEEEQAETKKAKEFLDQIQQMLTESDPEKYSGLIADIRGSLDVPIEERYIKAATHRRRRTRKEAVDAANDNK